MIQSRRTLLIATRGIRSHLYSNAPSLASMQARRAGAGGRLSPRHRHLFGGSGGHAQHHFASPSTMDIARRSSRNYAGHGSPPSTGESPPAPTTRRRFHPSPTRRAPRGRARKSRPSKNKKEGRAKSRPPKNKKEGRTKSGEGRKKWPRGFGRIKDPNKGMEKAQDREVPRAFLARTASEYAYISRCAVIDERTGEVHADPRSLFSEVSDPVAKEGASGRSRRARPTAGAFQSSHLVYFPPSSFPGHEPPRDGTPEVAFLGRSNTGKSSLINALSSSILRGGDAGPRASGGGDLARISKRPGRTQTINFFGLVPDDGNPSSSSSRGRKTHHDAKLYLVDMPGFGYAAAPDENVDEWQRRTQEFLLSRATVQEGGGEAFVPWPRPKGSANRSRKPDFLGSPPLKRLYLLVDSRLPEPAFLDLVVMGWCDDYAIPYTIVLTKVDGTSRANCVKLTNQMCMRYHSLYMDAGQDEDSDEEDSDDEATDGEGTDESAHGEVYMDPVVYWTSAKEGRGMEELLLSMEMNMFGDERDHVDDDVLDEDNFVESEDHIG